MASFRLRVEQLAGQPFDFDLSPDLLIAPILQWDGVAIINPYNDHHVGEATACKAAAVSVPPPNS